MNKNIIVYFSFHGEPTGDKIHNIPRNTSLYFSCKHGETADDEDNLTKIFEGDFNSDHQWIPPDWSYKVIETKIETTAVEIIKYPMTSYDYYLYTNDRDSVNSGVSNYVVIIDKTTMSNGYIDSEIDGSKIGWTNIIKSNTDTGKDITQFIQTKSEANIPVKISDIISILNQIYPDYNIKLVFSICRQEGGGKKRKRRKRTKGKRTKGKRTKGKRIKGKRTKRKRKYG